MKVGDSSKDAASPRFLQMRAKVKQAVERAADELVVAYSGR